MCGIYGAIGCGLDLDAGLRATDTLAHRGPDGRGHHHDEHRDVFLGHRRLSIIDLSAAADQPLYNEDGSLVLVLNGEIYNYRALRAELQQRGHTFRSDGDAEVVLHLYEELGMGLLERLHGMFAFALWDERREKLFLARDRIGIKPLVYHHAGRRLAFASELKAIRATPGLELEPDVTAYYDFLTYQFVPAPKTIYRDTCKLPRGHYLEFAGGAARLCRWWDVAFEPDESLDEGTALEQLDELLDEVVRDHLIADVPVGAFLSGGVDSSLIAACGAASVGDALETFTVGFGERKEDESAAALATASQLGLRSNLARFEVADALERLPLGPELFDEPFADHSFLPTLAVSELAAAKLKVVISGDGGDETHLGYGRYYKEGRRRVANALVEVVPLRRALVCGTPLRRVQGLRTAVEGRLGRLCHQYGGIPRETKRMLLGSVSAELQDYDDYWLYRAHDRPALGAHARQQYIDFATALPDGILTKVDRASMRVSLEVRPPLLDHRLVEWAARLPDRLKHRGGRGKRLLRASLARRGLGRVAEVRKRGFSVPMKDFVARQGLFRLERDLEVFDAFRIDRRRVQRVLTPGKDHQKLWVLHVLEAFLASRSAPGAAPLGPALAAPA